MSVAEPLVQAGLLGEAIDRAPDAVLVADESGQYLAVNQAACTMLGYTREELLALRITDIATSPEASREYDEMMAYGREPIRGWVPRARDEARRDDGLRRHPVA